MTQSAKLSPTYITNGTAPAMHSGEAPGRSMLRPYDAPTGAFIDTCIENPYDVALKILGCLDSAIREPG